MSEIKRKTTVRRPPGAGGGGGKPKKTISIVKQGLKQLYPEKDSFVPVSDIIPVPGLGAHPTECWETKNFKWPTDALAKDFPRSRILLYMYQSAWQGTLQVEQQMDNVAAGLLAAINAHRDKKYARRPIVFIGHSMGGLVIAKAITIADSHRKEFPLVFEATSAAILFGTPFKGAAAAPVASMYANVAERLGQAKSSELLAFMTPGNPQLRELVDNFTHLVGKVSPRMAVTCFYEERDTDPSSLAKLPSVFGKIPLPSSLAKFVTRESATLEISFKLGLAANHRDLVKFESPNDLQFVRGILKRHISDAPSMFRKRMNDVHGVDPELAKEIDNAFDGPYIARKREALAETFPPSSWITREPEYVEWLAHSDEDDEDDTAKPIDCLWVRAHEGRGKTSASLAVSFMNAVVKSHLLQNAEELLDMSEEEVKLQHGLLALRCLEHVKEVFGVDDDLAIDEETDSESESDEEIFDEEEDDEDDGYGEEDGEEEGDEGEEEDEGGEKRPQGPAMEYAVKYWQRHASKATFGMAENLGSEHEDFWMPESRMRRRWLTQFYSLTSSLESDLWLSDVKRWTTIHVASAFGFQGLVAALIRNGHEAEVKNRDTGCDTPLHLEAYFGRTKIAQVLLDSEAPTNEAIDTEEYETPLHVAAGNGHVDMMQLLMLRGADPNATSPDIGPVVNSAISSGNRAAVELLVERGVALTIALSEDESSDVEPPLTRAALLSDLSMFEYLIAQYAEQLPAEEYSKALVKSAGAGRVLAC